MLKKIVCIMGAVAIFILAVGCSSEPQKPKLGVSFGVGGATRWVKEKQFMEDRAKELGADITVRFNTTDTPKTWREDCFELICWYCDPTVYFSSANCDVRATTSKKEKYGSCSRNY